MAIMLSEAAAKEIRNIIKEQGLPEQQTRLRVGVKGGGCSGFSYMLDLTEEQKGEADEEMEVHGVKILCDMKSYLYLNGTEIDFKDEQYYWPVRWLKILARFPHEYKSWLCWGHTLPNGDPAKPVHASVGFDCMLLMRPKTVSTEFWTLPVRENKRVQFFAVVPLYPGETQLKLAQGTEELDRRFERYKISEIVNPKRRDVSKKDWWKLW